MLHVVTERGKTMVSGNRLQRAGVKKIKEIRTNLQQSEKK